MKTNRILMKTKMLNKLKVRNRWKKKSCFSSEVVRISIEKSGSALKSPDRTSTYNLLTNVKMDPKNLYLFPSDQASTEMLMLLFLMWFCCFAFLMFFFFFFLLNALIMKLEWENNRRKTKVRAWTFFCVENNKHRC